jgi:hypothetical protein
MTLQQHVWRASGHGAEEDPELHLEAHELCAVWQEHVEGIALLPLAVDMGIISHMLSSCPELLPLPTKLV